jgi:hypothetical protein
MAMCDRSVLVCEEGERVKARVRKFPDLNPAQALSLTTSTPTTASTPRDGCRANQRRHTARAGRDFVPIAKGAAHEHTPSAYQQRPEPAALPHVVLGRVRNLIPARLFRVCHAERTWPCSEDISLPRLFAN